jgi:hypothetical protein
LLLKTTEKSTLLEVKKKVNKTIFKRLSEKTAEKEHFLNPIFVKAFENSYNIIENAACIYFRATKIR